MHNLLGEEKLHKVFELAKTTNIVKDNSYIKSYPSILSYFSQLGSISPADVIRGTHMIYGWMPTVLKLNTKADKDLERAAGILTVVKNEGRVTDKEISVLMKLINNSLVGTSKLLHFLAPDKYAIWDSKIFSFVFERKAYGYHMVNVDYFKDFQKVVQRIISDSRFSKTHSLVNSKIGYKVTAVRATELIMFLNAPKY